jgi:hypothetical protein
VQPTDHIQIVTFRLDGLEPDEYERHCQAVAPAFAEIAGLRAKAWIGDARTNTFGGVYAWESREAMEAYVGGPVFGGLRSNPAIREVVTRDFGVLERPTRITRRRYATTPGLPLAPADLAWAVQRP